MRILVLTDTHGWLHLINAVAARTRADIVLHCGDFGFYDVSRIGHVPERELSLRVRHSTLPAEVRKRAFKMPRKEKLQLIRKHHLLGEFELYVDGREKFNVPVYAVHGNHEDALVVRRLLDKDLVIPNLTLLDENSDVVVDGWIRLVGK